MFSAGVRHIQSAACEPVVQAFSERTLVTPWRAAANKGSQHTPHVVIITLSEHFQLTWLVVTIFLNSLYCGLLQADLI